MTKKWLCACSSAKSRKICPKSRELNDSFHFEIRLIRLNFRLIRLNFRLILILGEILGELGEEPNSPNSPKAPVFLPSRLG